MKNYRGKELTQEQYDICMLGGTEKPFTGALWNNKEKGVYKCVICGRELFSSVAKYDSGTGWPSFWEVMNEGKIRLHEDLRFGMKRMEVKCAKCDAHLGHLFDDGPKPTGKRYCLNSAALEFEKRG